MESKLAELTAQKDKLQSELSEGAEEAEKSMRISGDLEKEIEELEAKVETLEGDLKKASAAHDEERAAWEKERGSLVDRIKAGEDDAVTASAASKANAEELSVSGTTIRY